LKMHVKSLGYPLPPTSTTSQLNAKFNGQYLRKETW